MLDVELEKLVEESRRRRTNRMSRRDRVTSAAIGGGFLVAGVATAVLVPSHRSPPVWGLVALVVLYAVASRVDFEIGAGSAVPTELVLVPMLFVLPLGWVPLVVAGAYVLGGLPEHLSGREHPERALIPLCGSWHALGPTLALALTTGEHAPTLSHWPVYVAALGAQFALDLGSAVVRDRLVHGVDVTKLVRFLAWVYVVDTLLAPVGLGLALAATVSLTGALLALPLFGLLAVFARERRVRLDHALELGNVYRGTALLAETFHDVMSEETLDSTLQRIGETLADLIPHDALLIAEEGPDGVTPLLVRGPAPEQTVTISVPLVARGVRKGSLVLYRLGERAEFTDDEQQLATWFGDAAALAIDNAQIRAGLEHQAQSDPLTGLANHRTFHERLRAELRLASRSGDRVALLTLDVDDFKRVNDVHGHAAGDDVLVTIAELLRGAVRASDVVCRIGGEEFAVIMTSCDAGDGMGLAQRLVGQLAERELEGVGRVTVSIGIAQGPEHAANPRELVACSEAAMMTAKARGKNQVVLYDASGTERPGAGVSRRHEDVRSIAHLKMLQSLAGKLNRLNDVRRIGETIVTELRTLIDYHSCRVYVADGELLVPIAFRGDAEPYERESAEALATRFGEGVTGRAAQTGRSVLVVDAARCSYAVQIPGTDPIDESMVAVPLCYGSRVCGVVVVSKLGVGQFDEDDVRLLEVLAGHASVALENARLYEEVRREADSLERAFLSTVEALANALEASDADTSSHARSIRDLALAVGRSLDLDDQTLKRLELGALLHDIGKIGIPSEILGKPGPLTPEERRLVETHPELGARILAPIERLGDVGRVVRHCHERWDGGGYPDGVAGEEIPLEARIVFVCDAYHAMTSDRPYRGRLPEVEARRRLLEGAGTQFDPAIVAAFLALVGEPRVTLVA